MNNTLIITCQTVDNRYLLSASTEAVAVLSVSVTSPTTLTSDQLTNCFLSLFDALTLPDRNQRLDLGCEGHLPLGLLQQSSYIH